MSKDRETEVAEAMPEEGDGETSAVPPEEQSSEVEPAESGKKGKRSKAKAAVEGKLQEEITRLTGENEELRNDYLRKSADFENFRKRMFREREEAIKYGNSNLLEDLVAIIDDFERAIKASEESEDFEAFRSGIAMIEQQFTGMLERKYGLRRFESLGEPFDPERHAAIASDSEGDGQEIVSEDYQKGYLLHDRVLRHAKVKVSSAEVEDQDDKTSETDEVENIEH